MPESQDVVVLVESGDENVIRLAPSGDVVWRLNGIEGGGYTSISFPKEGRFRAFE